MNILGIETSCDETAASVAEDGHILKSSVVASSVQLHSKYGGIVPEIAARNHLEVIIPVIEESLSQAHCTWPDIDAIAVTYGAGLGGSLLIGVLTARTLSILKNKPLIAINHVEAHIYSNFIDKSYLKGDKLNLKSPQFPFLGLIVSGGHTQLVLFKNHGQYTMLGKTQDDAIGEAFDKVAKMLGLPYPGGPSLSTLAKEGNRDAVKLPLANMPGYDLSFSGLKTAVLRYCQKAVAENYDFPSIKLPERLSRAQKADIAAGFERTATEMILIKLKKAMAEFSPKSIVIAGGVAANYYLRERVSELGIEVFCPDPKLCTDNAAMVAALGFYKQKQKETADPLSLDVAPSLVM